MGNGTFATAIGCIDGRASIPTLEFLKSYLHVDYVDYVSEAGPDKVLLEAAPETLAAIKSKVEVSLNAHHSQVVAIAAHHGCAGNPVTREEHWRMTRECVKRAASWGWNARIIGLWVNENWQLEVVCDSGKAVKAA